jgi:hypothetical protein
LEQVIDILHHKNLLAKKIIRTLDSPRVSRL